MKVRNILVLGILIREAFSFWTGHPFDFEIWVRAGYWIATKGYSPYNPLPVAPGVSFANDFGGPGLSASIGYLPFWPILLAGIYKLYALVGAPSRFLYYWMIKQPIIAGDVALAYYLYRYVDARGSNKASFVLKFWLFSPYDILLSGVWGMFDALAMLFVVVALTVEPRAYRGFWSGVATFVKSIPILFAVPLSWQAGTLRKARNLAIAIGVPALASLAIVWVMAWPISAFGTTLQSTLSKGGASLSLWELLYYTSGAGLVPSSWLNLFYSPVGYVWIAAVGVATLLAYRWFGFDTERGLIRSLLLITLTFLLSRGEVNEQYALYLFGFALIDVALWSPQRRNLLIASVAVVFAFNGTNDLLFIRYVSPIYLNALMVETSIANSIAPERSALLLLEAFGFWVCNVYYMVSLWRERGTKTENFIF